jgi:hypothetical protein
LQRAIAGTVERLGATARDVASELSVTAAFETAPAVASEDSSAVASVAIPLGVVEAVTVPRVRVSGDLLVSSAALARVEARAQAALESGVPLDESVLAPLQGAPLDGARPPDVLSALRAACESTRS